MERLFVDPPLVMGHGGNMETSADLIPDPPANFSPAFGTDELSTAIGEEMPKAEAPINNGLPPLKRDAKETASNIKQAAQRYTETDQTLSGEYDRHQFDAAGAPGSSGAAGAAGQMGQMMSMPMQMAAQAAQIPMQMMGMAAAIPQGIMQGVQSAMQQVGQMSGQLGGQGDEKPSDQLEKPNEQDEQRPPAERDEEKREAEQHGAAPGQSGTERAPEPGSGNENGSPATPPAPPVRPPAQTRPAEAPDGIHL
jgi:hypothetical protein